MRADEGLPFLLRYENVADYRNGEVWILDRRKYPAEEEFVRCTDYREVARAIAGMVTQSGGPWLAAAYVAAGPGESRRYSCPTWRFANHPGNVFIHTHSPGCTQV